jgi:hypothetical protein
VKHAVSQCGNNKSLKETVKGHSTESPVIGFSTPKRPPIMVTVFRAKKSDREAE